MSDLKTYLDSYLEFVADVTTPDGLQKIREDVAKALVAHDREKQAEARREGYEAAICWIFPTANTDPEFLGQFMGDYETPAEYRNTGNTEGTN
jgi:hypothetical protein